MSESPLRRLLKQSSHYSFASILAMVAGLISFPILTRVFSVADYGNMNLIAVTLTTAVALSKLGLQQSILRFNSEIKAEKSRFSLAQLYSTSMLTMLLSSFGILLLLLLGTQFIMPLLHAPSKVSGLLALASLLVVIRSVESALVNFLRGDEQTATLMNYQVAKKYFGLAVMLGAVLLISATLQAFYAAMLVGEATTLGVLAAVMFRGNKRPRPSSQVFSKTLCFELLRFGVPMMFGYELSGIALSVGDRYVINGVIGEEPLGLYSAAYNLCEYVQAAVIASVSQAVTPLVLNMWDRKGPEATRAFIARSLRLYTVVGAAVAGGVAAVGPELLPALASEKYASAALVLPWVIGGMVVDGSCTMVGAGLFIHRKTRTIMAIVLSCAVLNVVLNLVLVPRWGILGSAVATFVSYFGTAVGMSLTTRTLCRVALPWTTMLRAGLAALVMYFIIVQIDFDGRWLTLGLRTLVGGAIYLGIILVVDSDARTLGRELYAKVTG